MNNNHTLHKNQQGLVSIVVTLIIMIILTLIVIGFARISRREQRQVLDRQLSAQAFYAAETGVSDAVKTMKDELRDTSATNLNFDTDNYFDSCEGPNSFIEKGIRSNGLTNQIGGTGESISYTCLLVDPDPLTLEYGNVDTDNSRLVPVFTKDASSVHSITIGWQDKRGGTNLSGCNDPNPVPELPETWPSDCNTGMMRVDLVPVAGNSLSRDDLLNSLSTVYLYPWPSGNGATNTISYNSGGSQPVARPNFGNQGNIVRVNCSDAAQQAAGASKKCSLTITGLQSLNANAFMLRLKSIYNPSAATVSAARGANSLELRAAQAVVDSTGKSNDVLRRIQVRVPIGANDLPFPEFAIHSIDSICKRFAFAPNLPVEWGDSAKRCNLLEPTPY